MATNVCLAVLVGIPAAGKSTFSRKAAARFQSDTLNVTVICYDELCSDYTSTSRKATFTQVEALVEKSVLHKDTKFLIIVDDNMYYRSMRSEYLTLCRKFGLGFLQVYFKVPLLTALNRNGTRNIDRIPDDIIKNMHESLEVPTSDVLVVDASINFTDEIFCEFENAFHQCMENPKCPIEVAPREPVPASLMHRVDLGLRKIVHEKVAHDKQKGAMFNIVRRVLYKRIKCGDIVVEETLTEEALECYLRTFFQF